MEIGPCTWNGNEMEILGTNLIFCVSHKNGQAPTEKNVQCIQAKRHITSGLLSDVYETSAVTIKIQLTCGKQWLHCIHHVLCFRGNDDLSLG